MQFITITDYLLLPFYLMLIYFVAFRVRNAKYPINHPWRPYFLPALTIKIIGAIAISMIYQYYYGGGDTSAYYFFSRPINEAFAEEGFSKWINLVLRIPSIYDSEYGAYISRIPWYDTPTNYTVVAITAVFGIFTFNTFLVTAVLFSIVSFSGMWAMFRTFAMQYPTLTKHLAIAFLFIPSTIMWGSGVFKDTICMFGLGWMTYGVFRILIQRNFKVVTILFTIASFYLVSSIKMYIVAAFVPALAIWLFFQYSYKIKNFTVRFFLKYFILGGFIIGFAAFSSQFSDVLGDYSLDKVAETSIKTNANILSITDEQGSAYNIGELDPTPLGMLKQFPAAVNVSLFRPYLWEAKNPFAMLNALEATLFLVFTIKLLVTIGPGNIRKAITADPNIQFFLMFSVIFAFAVGLSSGNFGTLSRYRIPCLPPYACALMLIYYKYNDHEKPFLTLK